MAPKTQAMGDSWLVTGDHHVKSLRLGTDNDHIGVSGIGRRRERICHIAYHPFSSDELIRRQSVHDIQERFSQDRTSAVLGTFPPQFQQTVLVIESGMRRQNQVVMCRMRGITPGDQHRIVVTRWLDRQHIKRGTGQLAGGKC